MAATAWTFVGITILVTLVSSAVLVTSILAYNRVHASLGDFEGGRVMALTEDGRLVETSMTPGALATFVSASKVAPVRTTASVMTSGAATLNVSVEVLRHDRRRDWRVWTVARANVTTLNTSLVINLSGTGVLLPSDAPAASPAAQFQVVPAQYVLEVYDQEYVGMLYIFPSNSTMIFRPTIVADGIIRASTIGFTSFHANEGLLTISGSATWFTSG